MSRLPTLFVSHGAPGFAREPGRAGPLLAALGRALPRPASILVVSPVGRPQLRGLPPVCGHAPSTISVASTRRCTRSTIRPPGTRNWPTEPWSCCGPSLLRRRPGIRWPATTSGEHASGVGIAGSRGRLSIDGHPRAAAGPPHCRDGPGYGQHGRTRRLIVRARHDALASHEPGAGAGAGADAGLRHLGDREGRHDATLGHTHGAGLCPQRPQAGGVLGPVSHQYLRGRLSGRVDSIQSGDHPRFVRDLSRRKRSTSAVKPRYGTAVSSRRTAGSPNTARS